MAGMRYRLAAVAHLGLYEFVPTDGARIGFLLEQDEASALRRPIAQQLCQLS
jgi:hypothetical protein